MSPSDGTSALRSTTILILALTLGVGGGIGGAFATSAITRAAAHEPTETHGADGAPGQRGEQGEKGEPGSPGEPGPEGAPGTQGSAGPAGPRGQAGTPGHRGANGEPGTAGADGSDGAQGLVGPIGAQGLVGPAGPVGADGEQGPIGPAGEQGLVGPAGPVGADGEQGPIGPAGERGPVGPAGERGPVGPAGQQGSVGPAGPVGPMGPAGADGLSASLSYTVLTARPTLSAGTTVVEFPEVSSSPSPAASHANGTITIPKSGTYRITYVATPSMTAPSAISLAPNVVSSYALNHNGAQISGSVVTRPIFDVNVPLVFTLRTIVQGGSYSATSYLDAQAGDIVQFVSDSGPGIPPTATAITLIIERIS